MRDLSTGRRFRVGQIVALRVQLTKFSPVAGTQGYVTGIDQRGFIKVKWIDPKAPQSMFGYLPMELQAVEA